MENAFINSYVRFYIKQITQAKSLLELPQDPVFDSSNLNRNKRKIKYRNKYFLRTEIMGLVVMRQSKENRLIFVVDDSTGVIEAQLWNDRVNNFKDADVKIRNSQFVKILGLFDYYMNTKYIEIEKICISNFKLGAVNEIDKELIFHKLLFESHAKIFSDNLKENIERRINSKNLEKSSNEYNNKKKEFANKFLVFFLLYDVRNQDSNELQYVTIKLQDLFSYENFFNMTNDFVDNNKIDNVDLFLKDVFCFLQEKNFLQIKTLNNDVYNYLKNSTIIVKAYNNVLENHIVSLFNPFQKEKISTITYTEIYDSQNKKFFNYYTNEYLRVFLKNLCEKKTLIELCHNSYALYDYFN